MSSITVFGIANCDQVRKTLGWLRAQERAHRFHDFRVDGLDRDLLTRWCKHLPWTSLLNKRGQTWRALDESARRAVVDQDSAIELMLAQPALVKRPVIEIGDDLLLGFSAERIEQAVQAGGIDATPARSGRKRAPDRSVEARIEPRIEPKSGSGGEPKAEPGKKSS